jgi:RNA polymerase sigma-70 factor (ECF subfamily)
MDPGALNLGHLVERHSAQLYGYAYRLSGSAADAEDLTQHTFLTALEKWHQLEDESRVRPWLFAILRNAYLKQRRLLVTARVVPLEAAAEPAIEADDNVEVDEERLRNALADLAEDFRTPLILFYFQEFSYREIAQMLDVPIGTVMSRLSRGRAQLKRFLAELEPVAADSGRGSAP